MDRPALKIGDYTLDLIDDEIFGEFRVDGNLNFELWVLRGNKQTLIEEFKINGGNSNSGSTWYLVSNLKEKLHKVLKERAVGAEVLKPLNLKDFVDACVKYLSLLTFKKLIEDTEDIVSQDEVMLMWHEYLFEKMAKK